MMNKQIITSLILATSLLMGGCASSLQGDTYSRDEARRPQTVKMGTVEAIRLVKIEGTKSSIGSGAGTIVGGIAGSQLGSGKGSAIAAVIGAVAGGLAGSAAEEGMTRSQGVEITVREDNGTIRAYVQAVSETETFQPGDRVRILSVDGTYRISH